MRKLIIAACSIVAGCSGRSGNVDSAAAPDSTIVAGPPAVPSRLTPSPTPNSSKAPAVGADSIRGVVSVVGTSFEKRVVVATPGAGSRVEITGSLASLIGHVAGTEVAVWGKLTGAQLDAARFAVRAVDGQPAIDGTLKTEAGDTFIITAEGARTRIAAPPPPLQGREGARVWITGDPARAVSSFGFIDPPR